MRVLLVRLSSLGDVVLATAAVEALREDVPEAEIHVLAKEVFVPVFRGNPAVGRVLPWPQGAGPAVVAAEVRAGGYDWIVDLHGNLRTRILRLLVPTPRWVRYHKGAFRRRLAVALGRPGWLRCGHVVDRYVAALGPLGVSGRRRLPRLHPGDRDRERVDALLRGAGWEGRGPLVALAPGARWLTKAWPRESWVELLTSLHYNSRAYPVLLGGAQEGALCADILAAAGGWGASLAGRASILETAALLARCGALVTNDSAPLHLATAVGTPVVALFGPTVPGFGFYPLGPRDVVLEEALACRPCSLHGGDRCPEGHHRCLQGISANRAAEALEGRLGAGPGADDERGNG